MDTSRETGKCVARNEEFSTNGSEQSRSHFDLMYQLPRKTDDQPVAAQVALIVGDKSSPKSEARTTIATVNSMRYQLNETRTNESTLPKLELQRIEANKVQNVNPNSPEYNVSKTLAHISKLFDTLPDCEVKE